MPPLRQRFLSFGLHGKLTVILLSLAMVLGGLIYLGMFLVSLHLADGRGMAAPPFALLLLAATAGGIAVLAGLYWLARWIACLITAPLLEVAIAAEAIAANGRPAGRLPVGGGDEFGRLSAAFNTMVDRLAASYADLEQRVAERTRDYEASRREADKASQLLHEAVSSIAQGFTIYDENDRLVLCNETYRQFYADSRDLIVPGNTFEEIVRRGAERGQYKAALGNIDDWVRDRVRQHQDAHGEVIEQQLGDGRWLLIVEYRTPSGYIVGNRIDITELKNATDALRQHAAQLDGIFALSPDGFISFDRDRRIQIVSPAFLHMTGMQADELIGLDEAGFAACLDRACLPGARFPGFDVLRDQNRAAPGKTGPRRRLIELAGPGNRVLEVGLRVAATATISQLVYFRDVTHETEVDRMKSEFLSTAAHELRTPMASIYGYAELLQKEDFGAADRQEFLGIIFRQSELMIAIINELLDLARIEARRGKDFVLTRFDLRALLGRVLPDFMPPEGRTPPQLAMCAAPCAVRAETCQLTPAELSAPCAGPCWVRADAGKLTQAIGNVLSNAYKYSPEGGEVAVALRSRRRGDAENRPAQIGVHVSDHGIGMTAAQVARVCERFYRADSSGKVPGTGLGMSIVKEIVELLGGTLEIDSTYGAGTEVTLWLPAAGEAPE